MNAVAFSVVFVVSLAILSVAGLLKKAQLSSVIVLEYQRAAVFSKGVLQDIVGPGRYWRTASRTFTLIDMRFMNFTVPGQEILTADGVSLRLSLSGSYRVADPKLYLLASASPTAMLYQDAQQALREAVAGISFDDLLSTRDALNARLPGLLKERAALLGLEVSTLELRDIILPGELRRVYAQVVAAQKEGAAALERARGEAAALRSLANAARLLKEHPGLLQLRALQTMEGTKGNTLTLHLPEEREPVAGL